MELRADAVVLGAGAAGLAAARALDRAGQSVIVLEARERIGGRLLTREDAGLPVPIDLGGEFIHGTTEESFALLRAAGSVAIDTAGISFGYDGGRLRESEDVFEIVARSMQRVTTLHDDMSVEEFLRDLPDGLPGLERVRRYTRMLVEGFDAADPRRASVRAIAEEWSDQDSGQTARQFRPLGGYAPLLRTLRAALDPARSRVLLATPAQRLRWNGRAVTVEATAPSGATLEIRARAAIVTVPVGVLSAGTLRFEPELPPAKRAALDRLAMGPVVKLVLRFRSAFWERLEDERFRDAGFFHHPEARFPTFWSLLPLRTPLLIAWAGGTKADALAGLDESARVALAQDDLAQLFGGAAEPYEELESAYTHDWQRDPYARGAYSYVTVGGGDPRAELSAPVGPTLFFAGEAAAPSSTAGTAAGALHSGERAAREALDALAL